MAENASAPHAFHDVSRRIATKSGSSTRSEDEQQHRQAHPTVQASSSIGVKPRSFLMAIRPTRTDEGGSHHQRQSSSPVLADLRVEPHDADADEGQRDARPATPANHFSQQCNR